jgi:hypothetical protein
LRERMHVLRQRRKMKRDASDSEMKSGAAEKHRGGDSNLGKAADEKTSRNVSTEVAESECV